MPWPKKAINFDSMVRFRMPVEVRNEAEFHSYYLGLELSEYFRRALIKMNEFYKSYEGTEEEVARATEWMEKRNRKENDYAKTKIES